MINITLLLNFGVFFLLNYNLVLSRILEDVVVNDEENVLLYLQISTFVAWFVSLTILMRKICIPLIKEEIRWSRQ